MKNELLDIIAFGSCCLLFGYMFGGWVMLAVEGNMTTKSVALLYCDSLVENPQKANAKIVEKCNLLYDPNGHYIACDFNGYCEFYNCQWKAQNLLGKLGKEICK